MPRSQAVSSVTRCLSQPACPCNPGPKKEGIYSSVEADDSSEEEYRPTPKRRCAVPSSTPSSGATSQARSPSSDNSHEYESEECEEAMGDDTPPLQTGGPGEYVGKDGSVWSRSAPRTGRANAANVLHQAPGLPLSARRAKTRLDAFLLLIDPTILRRTVQHTIAEAQRVHGSAFNLGLDEDEFLAFIGLMYWHEEYCVPEMSL